MYECVCVADRLAEDNIAAVLQRQLHGDGGGGVLHQQEDHGAFGGITHHGDTLSERGEEGVQHLTPLTWQTHTHIHRLALLSKYWTFK